MADRDELRAYVLAHVDEAIEKGWVKPYYQAQVRSATGYLCGEEALARWDDPTHGMLMPEQFIPALKQVGQLYKIDLRMVECVVADLQVKRSKGVTVVPVSVNMSLADAEQFDLVAEISRRVDEAGESHSLLRVEFTESMASDDPEAFRAQVDALRAAGFEVWMDDFGSGRSSLSSLRTFDFDLIKLDMGFIGDIESGKSRDVVSGVVRIARKLGMSALAEGVETEEQALFLESIGCDIMQGNYFATPRALEAVIHGALTGAGRVRESLEEFSYWNTVGSVDLVDPTSNIDGRAVDGSPLAEFPAGIMECRDGKWFITRGNRAYREFLDRGGVLPISRSNLEQHQAEHALDIEFVDATERSRVSHMWERVAGRKEYGTGLQFYTRIVASSPHADAFMLAAVPTMLGTALGSYGDIPVAYAVLRVHMSGSNNWVTDAEFVYANSMYCQWSDYPSEEMPGRSFREFAKEESEIWFPYCYRAAVLKKEVHGVLYSAVVGHWLSFNMAPSPIDGCCIYAFTIADDDRRERQEIIIGRDSSDLIIDMINELNGEGGYEEDMNKVLEMMSHIIHPERLYVFERGPLFTSTTFEWCAEGVPSQMSSLQGMSNDDFITWERLIKDESFVMVPDISTLKDEDPWLYENFSTHGISSILAVPLYSGRDLLGFVVADNYELEQGFDTRRVLQTVAVFMSVRIANHRLMEELERAGTHDSLTGLLNRRGFDAAIGKHMAQRPDEPFVLALMDIDDFKTVNDLHGHKVGDEALRMLARELHRVMPTGAVIGRNGGDEFVIVLFGEEAMSAEQTFSTLVESVKGCCLDGRCYPVSVSVGFAGCPDQAADLKDAYTMADAALYAVKLAGKRGSKRYSSELGAQYRSQLGFTPRDIAENVPGAIMVHRVEKPGEILFANDELIDMFECDDLSDFMAYTGGSFAGIVHPDDADRVLDELSRQVELENVGAKNFANYRILTKGGKVRNVADNGRLVEIDEVGKVFYVVIIDRDERASFIMNAGGNQ